MTTKKDLITEIIKTDYEYSIKYSYCVSFVPIRAIKRKVMKKLKLNCKEFDRLLLSDGGPSYHEDGLGLNSCGSRMSSNLNYITSNPEKPTFLNSWCFFQINFEVAKKLQRRNK